MSYKIVVPKKVQKQISSIPSNDKEKVKKEIGKLSSDPTPKGYKKLSGSDFYRVRVGMYRIIYSIEKKELVILLVKVGHRREIYR